jgi:hypothetical protein
MRIEFKTESTGITYLPGLAQPVVIDTSTLPAEEAAELERLIQSSGFFALPEVIGPPPGAADFRQYAITVIDGDRRHTVRVADPVENPALQALLEYLKGKTRARRTTR